MSFIKKLLYLLVLLFVIIINNEIIGQTILDTDSLKNILLTQNNDTAKVKTLILLSSEIINTDPLDANKYVNSALNLSNRLKYAPGIIDALYIKSTIYKLTGEYDSAILFNDKAIYLSDSINDLKRMADNISLQGRLISRTISPKAARIYYLKSLDIYIELNDSLGMANSFNSIGAIYLEQAIYDSAIYYFLKSIKLSEQIEYYKGLGKAFMNIGVAYHRIKELNKAKSYLLKSISINKKNNQLKLIGFAYNNLGNLSDDENDYDTALVYYNKALNIYNEINYLRSIPNIYNNIGNIYVDKKEYSNALSYYKKAKNIYEEIGNKDGFIAAYKNEALIYGRFKNYDKALKIYDSCLVLAKNINSVYRMREIYNNIFSTYKLKHDYKNAFDYYIIYNKFTDSIFNIEKTRTITDLTLKYEKEKDQATILVLENENLGKSLDLKKRTNQRNIYLFTGLGSIVIVLFLLIFYRHKARKDEIISKQKIRQLEEEKKLLAAKSIVEGQEEERKRIAKELHDGLGVLLSTAKMQFTTIKDKSPENKPLIDRATKLLEQAAGDVRRISHNMMPGLLTRFGLYEAVEDLIDELDATEGLHAICEIKGDTKRLLENTEIMLYRVIQEMVNNTLKHAKAKNISLNINILPDKLNIQYSDDGKGFDVEEKIESKSIGLTSIKSRVKFLEGELSTESKPGAGVSYFMQIPI